MFLRRQGIILTRKVLGMKNDERLDSPLFINEVQKYYRETSITKQALLKKFKITEQQLIKIMKFDVQSHFKRIRNV